MLAPAADQNPNRLPLPYRSSQLTPSWLAGRERPCDRHAETGKSEPGTCGCTCWPGTCRSAGSPARVLEARAIVRLYKDLVDERGPGIGGSPSPCSTRACRSWPARPSPRAGPRSPGRASKEERASWRINCQHQHGQRGNNSSCSARSSSTIRPVGSSTSSYVMTSSIPTCLLSRQPSATPMGRRRSARVTSARSACA